MSRKEAAAVLSERKAVHDYLRSLARGSSNVVLGDLDRAATDIWNRKHLADNADPS